MISAVYTMVLRFSSTTARIPEKHHTMPLFFRESSGVGHLRYQAFGINSCPSTVPAPQSGLPQKHSLFPFSSEGLLCPSGWLRVMRA